MTTDGGIDYTAVLTDLERQRDELDAAINAIRRIAGVAGEAGAQSNGSSEIKPDSFFGTTILDGAMKYLRMVKQPQNAPDIARALKRGGLHNRSKNFSATVYTTLQREDKKGGVIVQMPDKTWAPADWYPSRPKAKAASNEVAATDSEGDSPSEPEQPVEQSPSGA